MCLRSLLRSFPLLGLALWSVISANAQTIDSFNPGANSTVLSLTVQRDGKILVAGGFSSLGGQNRTYVGKLNADGILDASFNPTPLGYIFPVALQEDGKVLVGGLSFFGVEDQTYLARFNVDGTLDTNFNVLPEDGMVRSLALQEDERILVGYDWGVRRFNRGGIQDTNFSSNVSMKCFVQPNSKILAIRYFTSSGGNGLERLNADGTLDTGFNPFLFRLKEYDYVSCLTVQADGKVLLGGKFTTLGGQDRTNLARLDLDGILDTNFNARASGEAIHSMALQADGKILVAGSFTNLAGQNRTNLGRLNSDGTADATWTIDTHSDAHTNHTYALTLQEDGKILVGGDFGTFGGKSRNNIARLNNTGPATQSLTFNGSTLTWLRGGTSPEVWRTTFAYSTNRGTSWINLGAGTRIAGGWQLTNLSLPTNALFRARGFTMDGILSSGGFVESLIGFPQIRQQSSSRTNNAGTTAYFSINASGDMPLNYQWRKNGVNLRDGGNISGVATAELTLTNVLKADEGDYSLVITNALGNLTSVVAALTVIDPAINIQPIDQIKNAGEGVTLSVVAGGTAPLNYQWRKDGLAIAGANQAFLTIINLQALDGGEYDLVVNNMLGSTTSRVAFLSVNLALLDSFNATSDGSVDAMANQIDGKILVGGHFTMLNGEDRARIGRLNPDGTLDFLFGTWVDGPVSSLALQADGRILVGGNFLSLFGQNRRNIGRLNSDGVVDPGFSPNPNFPVYSLALQEDGKILVGGAFTALGEQSHYYVGRLNGDGTLDVTFNPVANGPVNCIELHPDGRVLVGGSFSTLNGQSRANIARLNADGTVDATFNPGAYGNDSFGNVRSLLLQPDGRILVAGSFTNLAGQNRRFIGRLNNDGTLDMGFNPQANTTVDSLRLQTDGKILVQGSFFTTLGGHGHKYIGRLNPDGTVDESFNSTVEGTSSYVSSMMLQADGKILVAGRFDTLAGQTRTNIGRLNNTGPATQTLTFSGSTLTWMRGGTSPEVSRTTFESSSDGGVSWTALGGGTRIPGGWQRTGLSLPTNITIRARGYALAGSGSSWFAETVLRAPLVISESHVSTNGHTQFTASGPVGQIVVIEGSPDLKTWTPLQTITLGTDPSFFTDPQPALLSMRFYRLRSGP